MQNLKSVQNCIGFIFCKFLTVDSINLNISNINSVCYCHNLCNQFGLRSGLTKRLDSSGPKLIDTLMVFLKDFLYKAGFEKQSADNRNACEITQHTTSNCEDNIFPGWSEGGQYEFHLWC